MAELLPWLHCVSQKTVRGLKQMAFLAQSIGSLTAILVLQWAFLGAALGANVVGCSGEDRVATNQHRPAQGRSLQKPGGELRSVAYRRPSR